jgi:hypothetical protein
MTTGPIARPLLVLCDLLLLTLCFTLARVPALLSAPGHGPVVFLDPALSRVLLFSAVLWLLNAWLERLYRLDARDPWDVYFAAVRAALKTGALLVILLFLARIDLQFPRGSVMLAWLLASLVLPLCHAGVQARWVLRPGGGRRSLLLGSAEGVSEFFRARKIGPLCASLDLHGVLLDGPAPADPDWPLPVLGRVDDLPAVARQCGAARLVLCSGHLERARLNGLLQGCLGQVDELVIFPDVAVLELAELEVSHLGSRMVLDFNQNLLSVANRALKRTIDITGALAGLVLLAPLLLGCAARRSPWIRRAGRSTATGAGGGA